VVVDARGTAEQTHKQIAEVVRRKLKLAAKTAWILTESRRYKENLPARSL